MQFRRKAVAFEAFRLGIDDTPDWFTNQVNAKKGDLIIKGANGEIYLMPPDILSSDAFAAIYEKVE